MNRKSRQIIGRVGGVTLLAALAIFINQFNPQSDNETFTTTRTDVMDVHFIDVGQGDSILIEDNDHAMLIDAGENNKGNVVVDYLKEQNIQELDYVIGTHPHSDHIGGLDTVLDTFKVDKVILPSIESTTKTFEDVLDVIEEKGLKITKPTVGDQYNLGDASFTIIAPNSSYYEDMNDYSVGIKLTYDSTSFLLTGDAGELSEKEMLKNGIDLSADVLKLAHHGSSTGSCEEFLETVHPADAVISVGKDNDYGHPTSKTLRAMVDHAFKIYRTDEQGTVVFTSDGNTVSVNKKDYMITENDLEN